MAKGSKGAAAVAVPAEVPAGDFIDDGGTPQDVSAQDGGLPPEATPDSGAGSPAEAAPVQPPESLPTPTGAEEADTRAAQPGPAEGDTGLTDSMWEQAQSIGMSREDAEEFAQAGTLDKAILFFDRRMLSQQPQQPGPGGYRLPGQPQQPQQAPLQAAQGTNAQQWGQSPMQQPSQPVWPPQQPMQPQAPQYGAPGQQQPVPIQQIQPPDLGLDPDVHGEEVVGAFNKLNAYYANVLQAQQMQSQQLLGQVAQQLQEMQEAAQMRADMEFAADMDGFFEGLGEDFVKDFGKGPMSGLNPQSPAVQMRNEVVATALGLQDRYTQIGMQPPPFNVLLERAVRLVAAETTDLRQRRQAEQQSRDVRGRFAGRGSGQRAVDQRTDDERALEAMRKVSEEQGYPQAVNVDALADGLLDG